MGDDWTDEWRIYKHKGKRVRVSTSTSDFEGIFEKYLDSGGEDNMYYVCLTDAEQVYNLPDAEGARCTTRRNAGRIMIPDNKIEHYEFLEEIEVKPSKYCTECGNPVTENN